MFSHPYVINAWLDCIDNSAATTVTTRHSNSREFSSKEGKLKKRKKHRDSERKCSINTSERKQSRTDRVKKSHKISGMESIRSKMMEMAMGRRETSPRLEELKRKIYQCLDELPAKSSDKNNETEGPSKTNTKSDKHRSKVKVKKENKRKRRKREPGRGASADGPELPFEYSVKRARKRKEKYWQRIMQTFSNPADTSVIATDPPSPKYDLLATAVPISRTRYRVVDRWIQLSWYNERKSRLLLPFERQATCSRSETSNNSSCRRPRPGRPSPYEDLNSTGTRSNLCSSSTKDQISDILFSSRMEVDEQPPPVFMVSCGACDRLGQSSHDRVHSVTYLYDLNAKAGSEICDADVMVRYHAAANYDIDISASDTLDLSQLGALWTAFRNLHCYPYAYHAPDYWQQRGVRLSHLFNEVVHEQLGVFNEHELQEILVANPRHFLAVADYTEPGRARVVPENPAVFGLFNILNVQAAKFGQWTYCTRCLWTMARSIFVHQCEGAPILLQFHSFTWLHKYDYFLSFLRLATAYVIWESCEPDACFVTLRPMLFTDTAVRATMQTAAEIFLALDQLWDFETLSIDEETKEETEQRNYEAEKELALSLLEIEDSYSAATYTTNQRVQKLHCLQDGGITRDNAFL